MHLSYKETGLFHLCSPLLHACHEGADTPCYALLRTAYAGPSPDPHDQALYRKPSYQVDALVTAIYEPICLSWDKSYLLREYLYRNSW